MSRANIPEIVVFVLGGGNRGDDALYGYNDATHHLLLDVRSRTYQSKSM